MSVEAWTDYPLRKGIDPKGSVYPITVLAYDGNKYVLIENEGERFSIKSGYVFSDAACDELLSQEEFDQIPEYDFWMDDDCGL